MSLPLRTSELKEMINKDIYTNQVTTDGDEEDECTEVPETTNLKRNFLKPRISINSLNDFMSRRSSITDINGEREDPNLEKMQCTVCKRCEWARGGFYLSTKRETIVFKNRSLNCIIRRATRHDIQNIENLCDEEVNKLFSGYNLYRLIESAYVQFIMEEETGQIIAFIAAYDYPNPTYLPEYGWECWMMNKYRLMQINTQNSVFLHFFVWNKMYTDFDFMQKLAEAIFLEDPYIENFLFVLPPLKKLSYPYNEIFSDYEKRLTITDELMNTSEWAYNFGDYHKDLVAARRDEFGPKLTLLDQNTQVNTEMCNAIEEAAVKKKWTKKVFSTSNRGRKIITALCTEHNRTDAGLMAVRKKVDLDNLEQQYDTIPYYGFRASTKKDTWFRILGGEKGLQCFEKWCLEQSKKLLVDPSTQKAITSTGRSFLESMIFMYRLSPVLPLLDKNPGTGDGIIHSEIAQGLINISTRSGVIHNISKNAIYNNFQTKKMASTFLPKHHRINSFNSKLNYNYAFSMRTTNLSSKDLKKCRASQKMGLVQRNSQTTKDGTIRNFLNKTDSESTTSEDNKEKLSVDKGIADYLEIFKQVGKNVNCSRSYAWCPDMHPSRGPPKMEFFGESLAMEIEFYDPPVNQEKRLILVYLKKLFKKVPRTYILFKVEDDAELNPLIHYFHMVEKKEKINASKNVLYVCHKLAITGCLKVRRMCLADIEELMAICRHHPYKNFIQEDLLKIHLQKNLSSWEKNATTSSGSFFTLEYRCFVFTVSDLLIGFTVVRQHHNFEYYKTNYNLDFFTKISSHSVISHGVVRHFFINPLFKQHTRFMLRAVMKTCGWTTLLATNFSCYSEAEGCSVVQELEQWVQVSPRVLPEMSKVLDKRQYQPRLGRQCRALNLMTYSLSIQQKIFFNCYLVIVGSGDVARSFLEYLLLSHYSAKYGFKNITLIAKDGMQSVFPGKYSKATNIMIPWNGRYDQSYKDKCNIEFWVKIVPKNLIAIDRKKRLIELDDGDKIYFDYLFLFCGTQFPLLHSGAAEEQEETKITNEASSPSIKNVFKINNHYEAHTTLCDLRTLPDSIKYLDGGQYIVHGNCVEAFCCVAALLESGIRGYKISLILTEEGTRNSIAYIHSSEIMDSIKETLKKHKVNVYQECHYTNWIEDQIEGQRYVTLFHFKSGALSFVLKVIAIFCYHKKIINKTTYIACKKSGLWFDNKLTIQTNFLTSDENIYAGGSITSYSTIYRTKAYNHEFYNSVEIGVEIAKKFLERLLLPNNVNEDEATLLSKMVVLDHPLVICAKFPGGWHYARITAPGNQVLSMADRSCNYVMLKTGDSFDENGPGLFQIILGNHGIVQEIVCFRRKKIPVKDLVNLYSKHESLLNNLLCRFKGRMINDLFEFLNEPWALFIYDDRFSIFYHHLHSIYTKHIRWFSNIEGSFTDFVAYTLNLEKWKKITYEDKEFLEDLFCYHPKLKRSIEKHVIQFIENNEDLLIMLRTREYKEKCKSDFSTSRLLSSFKEARSLQEVVPQPIKHVVQSTHEYRELDSKPLQNRLETVNLGSTFPGTNTGAQKSQWKVMEKRTLKEGHCKELHEIYRAEMKESQLESNIQDVTSNINDMQYEKFIEQKFHEFQKNK